MPSPELLTSSKEGYSCRAEEDHLKQQAKEPKLKTLSSKFILPVL
jgi:hypothetical protein